MTWSLGQNTAVITFGEVIYTAKQEISNGNVQTSSQIIRIPYGTDFFFAAIGKLYESMKGVAQGTLSIVKSDVLGTARVGQVLKRKSYNRAVRIYKTLTDKLTKLR